MASTRHLDWLTIYAHGRGAIVRLLGDPAQLNSVEADGMPRLLAHDTNAVELTDLHRFTDPDEAAATLAIRDGDPTAIDYYVRHDRATGGSPTTLLDIAYEAWAPTQPLDEAACSSPATAPTSPPSTDAHVLSGSNAAKSNTTASSSTTAPSPEPAT